ncbi:hypothetical protein HY464_02010, partial [Candidatus Peregrinibacteria bacterium]|nr:hypothetical protein [Candidatus Peregrinibacteria bacterium]
MRWKLLAISLALYPHIGAFAAEPNNSINNTITHAEAVYHLIESDTRLRERVVWYHSHMPPLPLFYDVPQGDPLAPYLEVAFEEGIIAGNRERLFHSGEALRIEEAQSMIRKLRRGGESEQGGDVIFFVQPISRENFLALLQGSSPLPSPAIRPRAHGREAGRGDLSLPTIPTILTLPTYPPDLFAITLPTLGIDRLTVSHPKDPTTHAGILEPLKNGVGHLFGFPGGGGKVMIYGHSSGYPWDVSAYTRIFRTVNRL